MGTHSTPERGTWSRSCGLSADHPVAFRSAESATSDRVGRRPCVSASPLLFVSACGSGLGFGFQETAVFKAVSTELHHRLAQNSGHLHGRLLDLLFLQTGRIQRNDPHPTQIMPIPGSQTDTSVQVNSDRRSRLSRIGFSTRYQLAFANGAVATTEARKYK